MITIIYYDKKENRLFKIKGWENMYEWKIYGPITIEEYERYIEDFKNRCRSHKF